MKNNSLVNEGRRLFEEIEHRNFVAAVEDHVAHGDLHALFPEYKIEHQKLENNIKKAWVVAYAVGILLMVVVAGIVLVGSPSPEVAIWVAFGLWVVLTYALKRRYYRKYGTVSGAASKRAAAGLAFSTVIMVTLGLVGLVTLAVKTVSLFA